MSHGFNTLKKSISNDELAELPLSSFEGVIHLIETPEDLVAALAIG